MSPKSPHDWFRQGGAKKPEKPPAEPEAEPTVIPIDLEALAKMQAEPVEEEAPPEPDRETEFLSEEGPPPGVEPVPGEAATKEQISSIADRLEDVIAEYCRHGVRIGVSVDTDALVALLDDAMEASQGRARARVDDRGSAQDFFVEGLYDELIDQPANIFDKVTYTNGKQYWMPLDTETWRSCLAQLRQRILDESDT